MELNPLILLENGILMTYSGLKGRGWRKRLATFSSDDILAVHSRIRLAVL
jgi:hypothetical protein